MAVRMRNRLFLVGGSAVAAGLLVGVGLLAAALGAAWTAARERAQRQEEWRKLDVAHPDLTVRGAASVRGDLARVEAALAESWRSLRRWCDPAVGRADVGAPPSGVDAFLALTGFTRRMREAAGRAGVAVRPDEQFGFAEYAHEGPEADAAAAVDRQRRRLEELLTILWAAAPRQLDGVQRTPPRNDSPATKPARRGKEAPDVDGRDTFALDPLRSVRAPGVIETDAFRLTFTGQTSALRRLLNGIAAGAVPLVVRDVAVEPVKEAARRPDGKPGAGSSVVLILRPGLSRFTVTVEAWNLVGAPPPDTTDAGAALASAAAAAWPEPVPQRRGPGWTYDLFTPPSLYFDPREKTTRAAGIAAPREADARTELELLAVERAPFRWQLAGYVLGARGLRGIFADADTGETVVAGDGDRLGDARWVVKRVTLGREADAGDAAATPVPTAEAILTGEPDGLELTLSSRTPCFAGAARAIFASREDPGFRCRLQEGQSVTLRGADYCVERLDPQLPQAVVARMTADGGAPEILVLAPRAGEAAADRRPDLPAAELSAPAISRTP